MAAAAGETNIATLFADVHYFFSAPDVNPPHHRFSKSSYVYLFHNANERRGRIEIANHAGTPLQDAFTGSLDIAQFSNTTQHPTLYTLTVNRPRQTQADISQWHLPAHDILNKTRYVFPIHTLDIYFWKAEDAENFLSALKIVCRPDGSQLRVDGVPVVTGGSSIPGGADPMSPVVQKLEQAAISSPPAQQQHQQHSQTEAPTQTHEAPEGTPAGVHRTDSIATSVSNYTGTGVPTAATPVSSVGGGAPPTTGGNQSPHTFAPVAYNPAAPSAPEPIAHREKTPPPIDAGDGTGLHSAVAQDHHQQQQQQGGGQFAAPPLQHQGSFGQHGMSPPPQSAAAHTQTPPALNQTPSYGYGSPPPGQTQPQAQAPYNSHQQQQQQQHAPYDSQQQYGQQQTPYNQQQLQHQQQQHQEAPYSQQQQAPYNQQQQQYGQPMQGSQIHGQAYQPQPGHQQQQQGVQTGMEKQLGKMGSRFKKIRTKLEEM